MRLFINSWLSLNSFLDSYEIRTCWRFMLLSWRRAYHRESLIIIGWVFRDYHLFLLIVENHISSFLSIRYAIIIKRRIEYICMCSSRSYYAMLSKCSMVTQRLIIVIISLVFCLWILILSIIFRYSTVSRMPTLISSWR